MDVATAQHRGILLQLLRWLSGMLARINVTSTAYEDKIELRHPALVFPGLSSVDSVSSAIVSALVSRAPTDSFSIHGLVGPDLPGLPSMSIPQRPIGQAQHSPRHTSQAASTCGLLLVRWIAIERPSSSIHYCSLPPGLNKCQSPLLFVRRRWGRFSADASLPGPRQVANSMLLSASSLSPRDPSLTDTSRVVMAHQVLHKIKALAADTVAVTCYQFAGTYTFDTSL